METMRIVEDFLVKGVHYPNLKAVVLTLVSSSVDWGRAENGE